MTGEELRTVLRFGPWPPASIRDPSNRVSGKPQAIALGAMLFADARLSAGPRRMSCASCHQSSRDWTDGLTLAKGLAPLDRNTPSLWNAGRQRWFGWDGAADSLWAQSLRPIVNPLEMAADAKHVAGVVRRDATLACAYEKVFGARPQSAPDEQVLVGVAKSIAAHVETLVTARAPFDDYRDALASGDAAAAARYPAAAQRGLELFVGRAGCSVCHFGPAFSNGEFADIALTRGTARSRAPAGRFAGIKKVLADPHNLRGAFNDDPAKSTAAPPAELRLDPSSWGRFKVPGLRNVARTAPYMHDGRFATLAGVVRHYSGIDEESLPRDADPPLRALGLSGQEIRDLVAFLESLSSPESVRRPPRAIVGCTARTG